MKNLASNIDFSKFKSSFNVFARKKTFDILKENSIGKDIEVISGVEKEKAEKQLNRFMKSGIPI